MDEVYEMKNIMITRILILAGMLFVLSSCAVAPENLEEAIHEASANGDAIKIKEILEKAPELVNHLKKDSARRDRTLLHEAATREVAEILVSYGADINTKDRFNWIPLHTAKNGEVAEYLISKGANVHTEAARQFTPLHTVDNAGAAEALIRHRADVNRQANQQITPLYWQIQNGHAEVVRVLLEKRANWRERLNNGKTLLHFAADRNSPEIVNMLVKKGLRVDSVDDLKATPLHYSVYKDRTEVATVLLKHGANPNAKLSSEAAIFTYGASNLPSEKTVGGFTPLALAESEEMKALLRQHGAR